MTSTDCQPTYPDVQIDNLIRNHPDGRIESELVGFGGHVDGTEYDVARMSCPDESFQGSKQQTALFSELSKSEEFMCPCGGAPSAILHLQRVTQYPYNTGRQARTGRGSEGESGSSTGSLQQAGSVVEESGDDRVRYLRLRYGVL
jgi:hypothetical protein